jgi:hypothetical protein
MLNALHTVKQLINAFFLFIISILIISALVIYAHVNIPPIQGVLNVILGIKGVLVAPFVVLKNIIYSKLPATFHIGPGDLDPMVVLALFFFLIVMVTVDYILAEVLKIQQNKLEAQVIKTKKSKVNYGKWD